MEIRPLLDTDDGQCTNDTQADRDFATLSERSIAGRIVEYHTLIFDLDGTISNPSKGISRSINFALASQGYDKINEDTVSQYIGPPIDWTFRTLAPDADEAKVALLVFNYRKRYHDVGYSENRLYDGIVDALKILKSNGFRLGLCTSKRADFAEFHLTRR